MVEFLIHFLNTNILPIVHEIGIWFYVIVVLMALLESTVVVGSFVPGTVILLFFGFAASQNDVSLMWIILSTSIGAVIGDFISYAFGRYGVLIFKKDKGIFRLSHLEIGKAFFAKHGGKSVFLGRFIGPIRQIIPFIAGVVHMKYLKFGYLNIAGAILWAATYIILGYYFGSNWKLIDTIISKIGMVLTIVLISTIAFLFHKRRQTRLKALSSE